MVNITRWYPAAQSVVCFHVMLVDVLSIIHTVFLSRYSRCKTSSWGAGPPNQHLIRRWIAAGGRLSTTPSRDVLATTKEI